MVDLCWETAALSKSAVHFVGGMDEVGRGCLAGPVCVGVTILDAGGLSTEESCSGFPLGLADSKVLTDKKRRSLVNPIKAWVCDYEIGQASNTEIDSLGIMAALRLAAARAVSSLWQRGHLPQQLLLDGNINYLQPDSPDLFAELNQETSYLHEIEVETLVKGDTKSALVAGAACVAKVYRDDLMAALPDPGYGWAQNAGYGTAAHREAIAQLGVSPWHRQSWKLL